jgi:hypothetical protein
MRRETLRFGGNQRTRCHGRHFGTAASMRERTLRDIGQLLQRESRHGRWC